mgnify:CR=1 FL=1|tara:strand:+ start:39534 stop:40580 length:1047 start_codon:yes stop_codon:yes gene_type:complete
MPSAALVAADTSPGTAVAAASISPAQKVAVLLMLLGEDEAASIIEHLSPAQVEMLGPAMQEVASLDRATTGQVVDEFLMLAGERSGLDNGLDFFRSTVTRALGEARSDDVLQRATSFKDRHSLPGFDWFGPRTIAQILEGQHPQVVAATLTLINADVAAFVIRTLAEEEQVDIIYRLARLSELSNDAITTLITGFGTLLEPGLAIPGSEISGTLLAVEILKALPDETNKSLLARIAERDQALGARIEEDMLRFEDLEGLPSRSLQQLMQAIDPDVLAKALTSAPEDLKAKVFAGMSTRAVQTIEDNMKDGGPVSKKDILQARAEIIRTARAMGEAGDIVLKEETADVL